MLTETGFELFNRWFKTWDGTSWEMSQGMGNFMAGGLASNMYWLTALRRFTSSVSRAAFLVLSHYCPLDFSLRVQS